jgi:hypothetical protein
MGEIIPVNSQLKKNYPTKPVNFIPVYPIKPFNTLLDWLNSTIQPTSYSRKKLRLPVVIYFQDSYRIAISNTFIGTSDKDRKKDTIFLSLDDSSMGISLLSQLRNICPKTTNSCSLEIEGYWGSLIEFDLPNFSVTTQNQTDVRKWPFTVLKIHKLITQPEPSQEIQVFIESPSL